jgi:hypothetical protein
MPSSIVQDVTSRAATKRKENNLRKTVRNVLYVEIYEEKDLEIIEYLKKHFKCNGAETTRRVLREYYEKLIKRKGVLNAT